jgi:ribonuclease Z
MKPLFQARMLNGPFEDPVLYLDFLFERRALLFDLGNIRALAPRQLLRISDIFVSHTHMDHFADFDWLLRLCLGRDKRLRLFGPPGFIERVEHKLGAYTWNLVNNYETDLNLVVTELHPDQRGRQALFRCRQAFAREGETWLNFPGGILLDEIALQVRAAILDHGIPCLGFAVEEKQHVNLWKNRLQEMGLPIGPWLRDLKRAVLEEQPDDTAIRVQWRQAGEVYESYLPLGELKARVVRIVPGQKISYVVDVVYNRENTRQIVALVEDSHMLFIEATFLHTEAATAAKKCHLTAHQAGFLARQARVKDLIPIHFSPRYADREQALREEARAAFLGGNGYRVD